MIYDRKWEENILSAVISTVYDHISSVLTKHMTKYNRKSRVIETTVFLHMTYGLFQVASDGILWSFFV